MREVQISNGKTIQSSLLKCMRTKCSRKKYSYCSAQKKYVYAISKSEKNTRKK